MEAAGAREMASFALRHRSWGVSNPDFSPARDFAGQPDFHEMNETDVGRVHSKLPDDQ
jgi:hypothetical protein